MADGQTGGNDYVKRAAAIWTSEDDTESEESRAAVTAYRTSELRKLAFTFACVIAAVIVAGLSITYGSMDIGFLECYGIIWEHLTGHVKDITLDYIVVDERLPRIAAALITGAGLAIAGCVMQSVMKNPLADPYTTGISSGAGFGATLAITLGISLVGGNYSIVVNAFVFALIPMAIMLSVGKLKGASPTTMVMAGIAVMFIFNSFSTVLKLNADPDALAKLYSWTVGTVADCKWSEIPIMGVVVLAGIVLTQFFSRKLNILATGDDSAKAMGLDVENMRILLLLLISLVVATVVSFTGLIGFVGLVSPHVCRIFVGADNRYLVISSAMFGAVLLEVADFIGRTVIAPATLQVGVVTAFIGGPMFLYLILKQKKSSW
ncbi:MAG: iron ABC transporter permease [Candidatus Methanomethylophilaceae archaeon]|nr:iron ABC transporter permease [Candidatus Methanomethylophilaceae archaeon]